MRGASDLRARRLVVLGAVVLITTAWWAWVPHGEQMGIDHRTFHAVVDRMRGGTGYYDAFRESFLDAGIRISQGRSFRMPTSFLVWRALPADLLYPSYLAFVVVGTSSILLWLTPRPVLVLPVTLYLLHAGETIDEWGGVPTDGWLLQELWALPFVCGAIVAWRGERWWWAAALATLAVLTREITLPLVVGGLLAAHLGRGPRRPWVVSLGVVVGATAVHWGLAADAALPSGNEAPLLGSGRPPRSVLEMMDWPLPGPLVIGAALWLGALVLLRWRSELPFLGCYLAIGLSGLVVSRPYWGITFLPLTLLLSLELGATVLARHWGARGSRQVRQQSRAEGLA